MQHRLYDGNRSTGIVVAPDHRYPSMYRVHWPDREPSDIANLTRCKDAAERWYSNRGSRDLKWKAAETCSKARP